MTNTSPEQTTIPQKVLKVFAWIAGAAVGQYAGVNLLIPLIATGVVWWIGDRLFKEERKILLTPFSINTGHYLWLVFGGVIIGISSLSAIGVDLLIYTIGLIWLVMTPSLGPLYLLIVFQLLSIAVNGFSFFEAPIGSAANKALLVHIIWRVMALFFMIKLVIALKKKQVEIPTSNLKS